MEAIDQIVQVGGALLILAAFILAQVGRLETGSIPYLVLNLVGPAIGLPPHAAQPHAH